MQHLFKAGTSELISGVASALLFFCQAPYTRAAGADGLERGMQLAKQGKYKEAVLALQSASSTATSYYYQGYCYYQLHHESEAKQLFVAVAERFPSAPEAKLAVDFLKRLAPAYTVKSALPVKPSRGQAKTSDVSAPAQTLSSNAALSDSDVPSDMAKLPDEARIFFTTVSSGHMIVDASINGHPYKCMFDTGAPGLLFGKNTLRALGIPVPQGSATTAVSGWAGVSLPAWTMNLTIKLSNVERTLPATIQEDLDMPPLIGYAFIQGYQYEIDQKAKCLMLKKEQRSQQSLNSLYDVPCRVVGTKPVVSIEVNGKQVPAFIDTGASSTIMSPLTAAAFALEIPSDAPGVMAGGIGGASLYRAVNLNLRLGPVAHKDFQVLIGGNAGNAIGQDFLQGWRFTIDEKKGYLRFFH